MAANYCSNCGEALKKYAVVCSHCGRPVPESNRPEQTNAEQPNKETVHAEKMQGTPRDGPAKTKSTFFALFLSFFFPGLGQVYNGRSKKGVCFLVASILSMFLLVIPFVTAIWGLHIWILVLIFPLVFLLIWIWGLYDAFKDADRINNGKKPYREANAWEVVSFLILPIILGVLTVVILAIILLALLPYPIMYY
jgi:Phosphoglycerol transferase and related proteins, alkaline phosphatase superfamily